MNVDKRDYVIIWLSIQILVISGLWMKSQIRVGYLEGQRDMLEWASQAEDGVCGPYDQPSTKEKRGLK